MVPTPLGIPASGWMTFWYSEVVEIVDVYYRTRIDNIISKGKRKKRQKHREWRPEEIVGKHHSVPSHNTAHSCFSVNTAATRGHLSWGARFLLRITGIDTQYPCDWSVWRSISGGKTDIPLNHSSINIWTNCCGKAQGLRRALCSSQGRHFQSSLPEVPDYNGDKLVICLAAESEYLSIPCCP